MVAEAVVEGDSIDAEQTGSVVLSPPVTARAASETALGFPGSLE
jgi:hypothetical protein